MWDFITYDFDKHVNPAEIMQEVRRRSRKGSIVIFHDSLKARDTMLEVLPQALKFWKDNGYEIASLTL